MQEATKKKAAIVKHKYNGPLVRVASRRVQVDSVDDMTAGGGGDRVSGGEELEPADASQPKYEATVGVPNLMLPKCV